MTCTIHAGFCIKEAPEAFPQLKGYYTAVARLPNEKRKYKNIDGTAIMYYDHDGEGSFWKLNTEDDTTRSVYKMPATVDHGTKDREEVPWYLGVYEDLELLGKNWECTDVSLVLW